VTALTTCGVRVGPDTLSAAAPALTNRRLRFRLSIP
jgi:hypothetical protein